MLALKQQYCTGGERTALSNRGRARFGFFSTSLNNPQAVYPEGVLSCAFCHRALVESHCSCWVTVYIPKEQAIPRAIGEGNDVGMCRAISNDTANKGT